MDIFFNRERFTSAVRDRVTAKLITLLQRTRERETIGLKFYPMPSKWSMPDEQLST